MAALDLLLHPVRMRIIQAMLDGSEHTAGDLRAELPDIPSASLYRHIATLADAGVLEVVHERPVRGALERTFRLHLPAAVVSPESARGLTREDHRRAFAAFAGMLMADFDRYLAVPEADIVDDGVAFTQAALWLSDDEMRALRDELAAAITARMDHRRGAGRRKRLISTVTMPAH
ncbi:helix-turn-helix domain-containing protein [Mycobacterium sp. smrl_JER01]|uniref:helix-turn-helix domain-containing protein n=1 Tax=Mycobacterium sp. smrl_JER01 TaxID=3402633 RepID=UPI003AD7AC7A